MQLSVTGAAKKILDDEGPKALFTGRASPWAAACKADALPSLS